MKMKEEIEIYNCEEIEKLANDGNTERSCHNGLCSVHWLQNSQIDTSNRCYQREKVAEIIWKQDIMITVLERSYVRIPQIHIRIICSLNEAGEKIRVYELVDGQQRVTSILDYLNGDYELPKGLVVDQTDVGGLWAHQLRENYPYIYEKILDYRISCMWYRNLSDSQTADIFIDILNNSNEMKPQELRNAIQGALSKYNRDTARGNAKPKCGDPFDPHPLFERILIKKNNKQKQYLKHFSKRFSLNGRMEVDEWLSELIYLVENGARKGINQKDHYAWVKSVQSGIGDKQYFENFDKSKTINGILDKTLSLLKAAAKDHKVKLNSMTSMMMILYYLELENRGYSITPENFSKAFFETYVSWSDENLKKYADEKDSRSNQMPPFKKLFGGKNANAIKTIFYVLDKDWGSTPGETNTKRNTEIGLKKIDHRSSFKKEDIFAQAKNQGWKDYYTGEPLTKENMVGDHKIPRSWGIAAGGVTDIDNLAVCTNDTNGLKSSMDDEAFEKYLKEKKIA